MSIVSVGSPLHLPIANTTSCKKKERSGKTEFPCLVHEVFRSKHHTHPCNDKEGKRLLRSWTLLRRGREKVNNDGK